MNEYIAFDRDVEASATRKTEVWVVRSVGSGATLGRIAWFGRWRQYALYPERGTIWNPDCLDAVNDKIRELMGARRRGR